MQTSKRTASFGTAPVFLTAISTILGAIMFLRFGYAVGNVGFLGTVLIVFMGHMVTIPTAMAIAEIATNMKVEGGGEYYIISRSFGLNIGAAIGVSLFLSQAISVAFYIIAFAESFDPVIAWLADSHGIVIPDKRFISLPALLLMSALMFTKGANLGVKALYVVVSVLFLSLAAFFMGGNGGSDSMGYQALVATVDSPDPMFLVFAICFPAFTGMTAGVGLSGDLKNPRKSIPLGTLSATLTGMVVYILIAYKLAVCASPEELVADQLIMARIAIWGPIIPIGLACATLSSALGSYLVAPRTLQAIGEDGMLPWPRANAWLAEGKGDTREPFNSTRVAAAIAVCIVLMGDVDFVAQIISMFFMVTYGSICLISFLEHFTADPAYRPAFRSRWYISLPGALLCLWLMFQMSTMYALLAVTLMLGMYVMLSHYNPEKRGLSNIMQGAIFQVSRQLQIFLQKSRKQDKDSWRPSTVCISSASFTRLGAFELLKWMSHRYGFGTYIHFHEAYLSRAAWEESCVLLDRLVRMAHVSNSNIFVDTLVTPSYTTAIANIIQLPGISGKENNMVLQEFDKDNPVDLKPIIDNFQMVAATGFDVCILGSGKRGFGYRREIHIWLSPRDYENANLMILLSYIILGHPDWKGEDPDFLVLPEASLTEEEVNLRRMIRSGRLSISESNVEMIPEQPAVDQRTLVKERSKDADLIIVGFRAESLKRRKAELFAGYEAVGNVLFVNTKKEIEIASGLDEEDIPSAPENPPDNKASSDGDVPAASSDGQEVPADPVSGDEKIP